MWSMVTTLGLLKKDCAQLSHSHDRSTRTPHHDTQCHHTKTMACKADGLFQSGDCGHNRRGLGAVSSPSIGTLSVFLFSHSSIALHSIYQPSSHRGPCACCGALRIASSPLMYSALQTLKANALHRPAWASKPQPCTAEALSSHHPT